MHKNHIVLIFWFGRVNAINYLVFIEVTLDVLAIHISIIVSESTFSIRGHILDLSKSLFSGDYRNSHLSSKLMLKTKLVKIRKLEEYIQSINLEGKFKNTLLIVESFLCNQFLFYLNWFFQFF